MCGTTEYFPNNFSKMFYATLFLMVISYQVTPLNVILADKRTDSELVKTFSELLRNRSSCYRFHKRQTLVLILRRLTTSNTDRQVLM
jgi:hypothetical protein